MEQFLDRLLALRIDVIAFVVIAGIASIYLVRRLRRHDTSHASTRLVGLVYAALVVGAVLIVEYSGRQEQQRLRTMLEGIAPSYAVSLEHMGYHELSIDCADDDPLYLRFIALQKAWLDHGGGPDDVYTLHRDADGDYRFVVDSETDYDKNGLYDDDREQRTAIGERYDVPPQEREVLERAFAGEHVFDGAPSTDRWGTWVTSYSPIRDPQGKVVAVLGVDYEAFSWLTSVLLRRLATLCLFATAISALGVALALLQMRRDLATKHLLAEKNEQLRTANRELELANRQAQAATHAKTEFLANMSHELRTPLTAILGFADVLAEEGPQSATWGQHVGVIRSSGRHLLTILSDILDLSKLEAGVVELQLSPCNPRQLAVEVHDLLRHQATGKGIALRLECADELPACIATDPVRLRQILLNLVGNGIKFTEQGIVTLRVQMLDAQSLSFLVIDTGVGIPQKGLARLFQPFSQVDSSMSRRHGGSGLGLAISHRLANMLGGDIAVASQPGLGSTFRLHLPIAVLEGVDPADHGPPRSEPHEARTELSGRVLLAEDGPDNQRLIGYVLRKHGLHVDVVENGRLAVERLREMQAPGNTPYDLVLMDMQMPEMDGYEATRALRDAGVTVPIVAVTAHAMSADRDRCLQAGCDDFLTKPIDRKLMLTTIATQLARGPARV